MKRWKKLNFGFIALMLIITSVLIYHFVTQYAFSREEASLSRRLETYIELELQSYTLSETELQRLADQPSPQLAAEIAEAHWLDLEPKAAPYYPADGKSLQQRKSAYLLNFRHYLENGLYLVAGRPGQINSREFQLNLLNKAAASIGLDIILDLKSENQLRQDLKLYTHFSAVLSKENGEWKFVTCHLPIELGSLMQSKNGATYESR